MAAGQTAEIIELLGKVPGCPVRMTCADGAGILKGVILKLADPRTASASDADDNCFAGISAAEKVASDGTTSLAVYTHGIFEITTSAAVTAGERVYISAAQKCAKVDADALLRSTIGIALETTTGDDETAAVYIGGFGW